jgi:putative spermidine/putrescine transport system permease protein
MKQVRWLRGAFFGCIVALLLLPLLVVVPVSFVDAKFLSFPPAAYSLRWYERFFTDPDFASATFLSLRVALGASAIAVLVGTCAAIAFARYQFPGRRWLLGLILAPAIVPVIILALGSYFSFAQWNLLGSVTVLTVLHATLALPFVVTMVTAALEQFDTTLERAARTLGAGPFRSFLYVTLPSIRPSILAAGVFGFFISFDDLVLALFLMGREYTLPVRIWQDLRFEIDPTVAAAATLLLAMTVAGVCAAGILFIRQRQSAERNRRT